MSNVIIDDANLYDIADAIREKSESTDKYLVSAMAAAIKAIQAGTKIDMGEYEFTSDGTGSTSYRKTINHNLGVMPHTVIWITKEANTPSASSSSYTSFQRTLAAYSEYDGKYTGWYRKETVSKFSYWTSKSATTQSYRTIYSPTEGAFSASYNPQAFTSTSFGTPTYYHKGDICFWIAIA